MKSSVFGNNKMIQFLIVGFLFSAFQVKSQSTMRTSLPIFYGDKTIAYINCKNNYANASKTFTIKQQGIYGIFCSSEILEERFTPDWQGECLGLFFDLNNEKKKNFGNKSDDISFNISATSHSLKLHYKIKKISSNEFVMEAFIPWKSFGRKPAVNTLWGFDMNFSDNDGKGREPVKTWNADDSEFWMNSSLFGSMKFVKSKSTHQKDKSILNCLYSNISPKIDGVLDQGLKYLKNYQLTKVVQGKDKTKLDCQVSVKTCWNNNGMYFYAKIIDDLILFKPTPIFNIVDYGWLEDSVGNIIWEVNGLTAKYAGGSKKNHYSYNNLFLKKGIYKIRYISDESHSPKAWDSPPPHIEFYGISLH